MRQWGNEGMERVYDALVIGAGPAGLASSHELSSLGISHVVLERGQEVGQTWADLYDSLVLHTTRALSALPGLPFPSGTPQFPTRLDLLAYLRTYAQKFSVPVQYGMRVADLRREADVWSARTADGHQVAARTAVVATGIVSNPYVPDLPGRDRFTGRIVHSVEFRRAAPFTNERVLVIGGGNSAADISVALAQARIDVTLAIRSGATVLPLKLAGIPIQYLGFALTPLPRRAQRALGAGIGKVASLLGRRTPIPPAAYQECTRVPVIGGQLSAAIESGAIRLRCSVAEILRDEVQFSDGTVAPFDTIILATGYRPAIQFLEGRVRRDRCGFAERSDAVTSADHPDLYLVGHNQDIRGGLYRIGRDARRAARRIKSGPGDTRQRPTERRRRHNEK